MTTTMMRRMMMTRAERMKCNGFLQLWSPSERPGEFAHVNRTPAAFWGGGRRGRGNGWKEASSSPPPPLLWRAYLLSSAYHYDAATLPRKLLVLRSAENAATFLSGVSLPSRRFLNSCVCCPPPPPPPPPTHTHTQDKGVLFFFSS